MPPVHLHGKPVADRPAHDKRGGKRLLKGAVIAAGIIAAAVLLDGEGIRGTAAGPMPGFAPKETRARAERPERARLPIHSEIPGAEPVTESHMGNPDNASRNIQDALIRAFPYSGLDCRMMSGIEYEQSIRASTPLNLGEEYSMEGPFHALAEGSHLSPGMRASLGELASVYDRKDVWGTLAFVLYLDALNLESPEAHLYEEYSQMVLTGVQSDRFPDPLCMERIAASTLLLRKARMDLSDLLAEDPSNAAEVLAALPRQTRQTVLSGAVGAALAKPGQPEIEKLFDFLAEEEKIALIEMYDGSLPEEERLPGLKDGSSLSAGESGLWHLLRDRMRRFEYHSRERERLEQEAARGEQ